jgi:hypothetical protein
MRSRVCEEREWLVEAATLEDIMSKSPLVSVKERFESKQKLVAAVEKLASSELWLARVNEKKGLARVSNAKLLHLHDVLTDAKTRFGSRDKLVASIVELAKRPKDKDYQASLGNSSLPRLLDLHRSLEKASKRAAKQPAKAEKKAAPKKDKAAKAAPAAKTEAAPKAAAKKPAAKEAAPKKTAKKS